MFLNDIIRKWDYHLSYGIMIKIGKRVQLFIKAKLLGFILFLVMTLNSDKLNKYQ